MCVVNRLNPQTLLKEPKKPFNELIRISELVKTAIPLIPVELVVLFIQDKPTSLYCCFSKHQSNQRFIGVNHY